jgi:CSLREA domain-containing protein
MYHWFSRPRMGTGRAASWLIGIALIMSLPLSLGPVTGVHAAPLSVTVTTTADSDSNCATTGETPCSLRDAIRYANGRTSADTTTITLPAGTYNLTHTGYCEDAAATGDLDITQNVILNGADPATTIIDGMGSDRVFDMRSSTRTVSITNVTVRDGVSPISCGSSGGGIAMVGNVTLTNVVVTNNAARSVGGINGIGNLTLINSTVRDNHACGPGGIRSGNGTLTLINSTVSGNVASSTLPTPSLGGCPGGVRGYAGGIDTSSVTHITNSTISGNSNTWGASDDAGGIRTSGTTTVAYRTIAGNTISGGSGSAGGILNRVAGSSLAIQGTIFSANAGGSCANTGTLTSQGYNLSDDFSCSLNQGTDLPGTSANLGDLASNGGPTQTHALLAGSRAIDAGGTSANGCPNTDQRGITRPQPAGGQCDIGAVEQITPPPTPTNLAATGSTYNSITWTWSNPDPTAYIAVTDGSNTFGLAAGTTSYTKYGVPYGGYAGISIAAFHDFSAVSAWTPFVFGLTTPITPYNPHTTGATTSSVSFGWSNYDSVSQIAVSDYTTISLLGTNATSFTKTAVASGYYACIAVEAYNALHASGWSGAACGYSLPTTPTLPVATNHAGSVSFTWTNHDPYSYIALTNGGNPQALGQNVTTYTQTGMTTGQYACIKVAAYNFAGASAYTATWACGQAA